MLNKIYAPSLLRTTLMSVAIAGGVLTAASLAKTPGKSLNPTADKGYYVETEPNLAIKYGAIPKEFGYDNSKSIATNVTNNLEAADYKMYKNVIDPITEKPIIPATTTALALLGLCATKPKENSDDAMQSFSNIKKIEGV